MSETDFSQPQRQEKMGIFIMLARNLRGFINLFIVFVASATFSEALSGYMTLGLTLGFVLLVVYTLMQFMRFKYHVEDDSLILNKGVITREKLVIPFDRIQSVHLHENLIQQLFRLTGLKIDTAGSGKKELQIPALSKPNAIILQKILEGKKRTLVQSAEDPSIETSTWIEEEEGTLLVQLNLKRLFLVGITQNHVRNGFIALGLVWGYAWQLGDYFQAQMDQLFNTYKDDVVNQALTLGFYAVLSVGGFFIAVSVLISLVRVFLKYFNLRAMITENSIKVRSGLIKRNEYTVPIKKIQFMEWGGNFLRRIPGIETVGIYQSQSTEQSLQQAVSIPACFEEQNRKIMDHLFPEEGSSDFSEHRSHKYQVFLYTGIFALIGLVPLVNVLIATRNWWAITYYVLFLLLVLLMSWKRFRSIRLRVNKDLLIYERGWLFTKRLVIKNYKVQSVEFRQSIFQRRRGIGHLSLHTAAGTRTLRFFDQQLLKQLHDYFLYKVESHSGSWM